MDGVAEFILVWYKNSNIVRSESLFLRFDFRDLIGCGLNDSAGGHIPEKTCH